MSMTRAELKEELIGGIPSDNPLDWNDDPGKLMDALAGVLYDRGVAQVEALRHELCPATATETLPDWEDAIGVRETWTAREGSIAERRGQVISRLRERGPMTLDRIRSVLQGYLQYADPADILISEVSRTALRTAHTRTWTGSSVFTATQASVKIVVWDDPRVSRAGAQVDLTFSAAVDLSLLTASLYAPDSNLVGWGGSTPLGKGTASSVRLYAPGHAGAAIFGTWELVISISAGSGTLTRVDLFVEGRGRDVRGGDGLGSAKFWWAPIIEKPKIKGGTATANEIARAIEGAQAAVARINYATRRGDVALWPEGVMAPPADVDAIPDDPHTIPDMCIPG